MKKRNISKLLCMAVCVSLLTGCGGEYAGITEGDIVSGSAVSGEAVSGDAIREKTVSGPAVKEDKDDGSREGKSDISSHRFCTDTNLYYVSEDEEKLMQAWTDGTHRKCIKEWPAKNWEENYVEVVYADENWLYYDVTFDYEEEITYRAPIEKDAQGYDVIKFQEEEELVKTDLMVPLYVDADYWFYIDLRDDDKDKLIKYDLRRKKTISEDEKIGFDAENIFRLNNHYFCLDDTGCCYVQETDAGQWEKICDRLVQAGDNSFFVSNGREVFYSRYVTEGIKYVESSPFEIMGSDGEKERRFVSWEQVSQAVKEAAGAEKLDVCMPAGIFWQEGRLYIQIQAGWMKEGLYHMEYKVFSQGEDGSGLQYEKKLTECMKSHVKERTGKWTDDYEEDATVFVEHMVINDAWCIAMVDGTAYLSLYDYGKDKGRLGCYDLDTGEFRWITRKDAAFYKFGWDNNLALFYTVFHGYYNNEYADRYLWPPSEDKDYDGNFLEG